MPSNTLAKPVRALAGRIDELARISDERGVTTRTFLSPAMGRANALVGRWMRAGGLTAAEDGVGNLIGRVEGPAKDSRTLLLGSHLDTVRDAGRFDGILGVLLPLAALEVLRADGVALPFAVEILGFSEEEGVRFSSAYLGSKGYTGRLKRSDLGLRDAKGISVEQALANHNGRKWAPSAPAHARRELIGYVEAHIEQGPVLEARGCAVGVVSAIAGQTRAKIVFTGKAGHAGTTPMALRADALAGAAAFIVAVETYARTRTPLVATVGRIAAYPGAANVIAGSAELTLDVRHPVDAKRKAAYKALGAAGRKIAKARGLSFTAQVMQDNGAVPCSGELTAVLTGSVRKVQGKSVSLASGAGHDAVILSALTPVAMLFVRCRDGLSHHPDEHVEPADLGVALAVMVDFLKRMASEARA
jgi:allantoate deiminase